jgi:hypothetical protein
VDFGVRHTERVENRTDEVLVVRSTCRDNLERVLVVDKECIQVCTAWVTLENLECSSDFTYHKTKWSPSIWSVNTANPKQSLYGTYVYPSLGEVGELEKRNEVSYMC